MDRMMGLLGMLRWGLGGLESYSCFLFFFSRFSWMFIHVHRNSGPPLRQILSIRNLNGFNGWHLIWRAISSTEAFWGQGRRQGSWKHVQADSGPHPIWTDIVICGSKELYLTTLNLLWIMICFCKHQISISRSVLTRNYPSEITYCEKVWYWYYPDLIDKVSEVLSWPVIFS